MKFLIWYFGIMLTLMSWSVLSPFQLHEGQLVSIPGVVDSAIVDDAMGFWFMPTMIYCRYNLHGVRAYDDFYRWQLRLVHEL